MNRYTCEVATRLAHRIWNDPTADAEKKQLARAWLLASEGRLPGQAVKQGGKKR